MNNNKSIFNISIVEIMLILFFMFISISIYQLTYKSNQISELNEIVESEREIIKEIVEKDYPKLESRIDDLVNLEKCKKLNTILNDKNTGIDYLTNKMFQEIKSADAREHSKKYDNFQNEKIKLNAQISNLKNNELTINILTELNQQDKPLHQQITSLEKKVKENYQNRMILINKIRKLKTDEKVKYILSKLDKNNAPLHEQISAILKELNQLKQQNRLGKSYNTNTTYVLDNLKQNNSPIGQQLEVLRESLNNKNLLLEIESLKNQLARNLKTGNEKLNIENMTKTLNNLENIRNNPSKSYNQISNNVLEKIGMNDKPLNEQITNLKNTLDLANQLNQQITDNLKVGDKNLKTANIEKALNNLESIKNDNTNSYDTNSKDILKQLDMSNKPLLEQINQLKNKLDLDKKLKEQLAKNLKAKNDDLNTAEIKEALDNLQKIQNKATNSYDPNSKDILKQLTIVDKPLAEQISYIENKLNQDDKLKKQIEELEKKIDKNLLFKDPNMTKENIEKALKDINKIKNTYPDKTYIDKLKSALDDIKEIQNIKNKLSNKINTKPVLNKNIENAIKYFEDKASQPNLKADKDVQATLDKFNIKGTPTNEQLSDLYKNLYSTPSSNTNVSELNFVINRLNNQNDLKNRVEYINNFLEKTTNTTNNIFKDNENYENAKNSEGENSKEEIAILKNQIKYLQKKIEKSGVSHLPCFLDDEGSSIFLFILSLRDNNIHVKLGSHEKIKELSKDLPNMDKLVDKTMSLKKFMRLTKPIFEQSVQDECRQFVYFEDKTVSKKEYKRKTLTIQHHFYKYIDYSW